LTNTTVSLQWLPPKFPNGIVRYYHIHYYLDDILQQQDLIDSFDEQQVINEQRRITVHDTKVFKCIFKNIIYCILIYILILHKILTKKKTP